MHPCFSIEYRRQSPFWRQRCYLNKIIAGVSTLLCLMFQNNTINPRPHGQANSSRPDNAPLRPCAVGTSSACITTERRQTRSTSPLRLTMRHQRLTGQVRSIFRHLAFTITEEWHGDSYGISAPLMVGFSARFAEEFIKGEIILTTFL